MRNNSLLLLPTDQQEELAASLMDKIGPGGIDLVRTICPEGVIPEKFAYKLGVTANELELLYKFICCEGEEFHGFGKARKPTTKHEGFYGRGRVHYEDIRQMV